MSEILRANTDPVLKPLDGDLEAQQFAVGMKLIDGASARLRSLIDTAVYNLSIRRDTPDSSPELRKEALQAFRDDEMPGLVLRMKESLAGQGGIIRATDYNALIEKIQEAEQLVRDLPLPSQQR